MKKQNININNAFIVLYLKNFLRLQTNDFALCIVYVVFLCTAKLPLEAATQLNESIRKKNKPFFHCTQKRSLVTRQTRLIPALYHPYLLDKQQQQITINTSN